MICNIFMLRLNEHQLLQSYSVYFVICFDIQVFFFHHATAELSNGFFNGSDEPGQGDRFKQIIYGVEFKTVNGILGIGRGKYYGRGIFQGPHKIQPVQPGHLNIAQ